MQFTRLRLNGFKSFVDPTDLVIHTGLTGVVGPNGCGKSNLLEALRWVMGETRPKAMRGDGMEDVIFQGSAARPARGFAEVSLHIDNADRLAPSGFNDADKIEIVRRITRDAGSAYKAAGKDVRARDVQMLFADASTGAHSPALVRQGQIAELINARPKARRRILEEAAGISGLYQRRHEAELRLKATETNLARIDDVLGNLASQLAQLARQAKQAARYRAIGESLRRAEGALLYRRWQEADAARTAAEAALTAATRSAAEAEAAVSAAARRRAEAEAALPALREEDAVAGAVLQRLEAQRGALDEEEARACAALETLDGRITQLSADIARESELDSDAGATIARLEREQAELAEAAQGQDARERDAATAAEAAAARLSEAETQHAAIAEQAADLAARHQAAERRIAEARRAEEAAGAQAETARAEAVDAAQALERAGDDCATAEAERAAAADVATQAETALGTAEAGRVAAREAEETARATRTEAEGTAGTLRAEVAALARLVAADTGTGARLLDRVEVAEGFEAALGAALGDDLDQPQRDGPDASGWVRLAPLAGAALPEGATPLGAQVSAPEVLARRLAAVGVVAAQDGPDLQPHLAPGQRLVSRDGDLWRWDGLCLAAADAPSAAALRLQQLNRLAALRGDLEAIEARAAEAGEAHAQAKAALDAAVGAEKAAREARRAADERAARAGRALGEAEAARNRAAGQRDAARESETRHRAEAERRAAERAEAEADFAALDDLDGVRAQAQSRKQAVETARADMLAAREKRDALQRQGKARARRAEEVTSEIARWRDRLATAQARIGELDARRAEARREHAAAADTPARIAADRETLRGKIAEAETRRRAAGDALAAAETALREATTAERDAERSASDAREARARAEAQRDAAAAAASDAEERLGAATGTTPDALLEQLALDPAELPAADAAEAEVTRLRRQRDALGAVNLRAEEDARELQDEHDTLSTEKADLEAAIRTLRGGIAALNREGRERLLAAFEQVNESFGGLFTHLFGGGEARLVMVESDDPLEAGLEIMAQPPGKKLATLSLLSGGEQTLTALALIFAVFLANPAPICVLDEVDAPLDDANVARFCDLLDEMTRRTETRFLIITHNAITMSRMDRLFGVTMAEQGVSQLVSVDLKRAEAMVA